MNHAIITHGTLIYTVHNQIQGHIPTLYIDDLVSKQSILLLINLTNLIANRVMSSTMNYTDMN